MVGVSRSPLSKNLRMPARNPREVDTSTLTGVAAASQRIPSRVATANEGTWFFPPSVSQADRQRYLDASMPRTPAVPAVPTAAPTAPTAPSAPVGSRGTFGGYTQTDADRFMEAMRADTGGAQGYAFGGGYDPLIVPPANRISDDAWQTWTENRVAQEQADADAAAAAEAARQQAAAVAAERARVAGVYGGQISELEAALGGVGGVYAPMLQQIADLYGGQEQGVRDLYAGYGTQLAEMGTAAQGRIDAATAQAMERLAGIDPEAGAFQWNVQAGGVPQAAAANYLQAIGASPAEVDAARMLGESLIAQQLGTAQQVSAGTQAGLDRERAARQAASTLLAQQATGGLSAQQAAYGAQLSAGELARVQALQQAGLSQTQALQLAQREEEERIRNAILQSRLDAAAAGVSL